MLMTASSPPEVPRNISRTFIVPSHTIGYRYSKYTISKRAEKGKCRDEKMTNPAAPEASSRWLGVDAPKPHEQGAWVLWFVPNGAVVRVDGGRPTSRVQLRLSLQVQQKGKDRTSQGPVLEWR